MLDITFFTSNPIKLAHARYLAEGRQVRVNGFRQKTYHATYFEPRVDQRDELLAASYKSAVEQSKKAGIFSARHFFILEDTSVTIDALSSADHDVPGLDIKYWMREATFETLDQSLRAAGNNRRARVRSDVLLHVPAFYKERWGLSRDYLVFTGEQEGAVVSEEASFETNPVFPWLDNVSFNKWFVPKGARHPLGQLPIARANRYDFRARSFGKLFAFLDEHKLLTPPGVQRSLPLTGERNFIVCGYTCAGKTTVSQYLARHFDYLHVEASDFMYLNYYIRHDYQGGVSIGDFAERALIEKPEIAAEKIAEYLSEDILSPSVVSGFRSPKEAQWLIDFFADQGKEFELIFIEAEEAIRFERMSARKRGGDVSSIDKFRRRDNQQQRMGLGDIAKDARTLHWTNNGTRGPLFATAHAAVGRTALPEPDVTQWLTEVRDIPAIRLEDAILIALLSLWGNDETRRYFSTGQIARRANALLNAETHKHKDNVSRYFNQYFYADYDITADARGVRRYRLSNTGYGKALRTLRRLIADRRRGTTA